MAQLADTVRIVELVCARLCHDLGGLIGTVGNALEMVAEDADKDDEVLAFASSAGKALAQRLRLMRLAWGPEGEAIPLSALIALATPPLAARRVDLDTRRLSPDIIFEPSVARVVLNLLLLACDCIPKGGTIVVMGDADDLLVRIVGVGAVWPTGLASCLSDEATAIAAMTSARTVQMPLTALLALSRNLRLSPVLGADAGIQALRLTTARRPASPSGEK